ncbi:MAG: hypothetical protein RMK45_03375 [Armatimonadota bacterium]|nr:hypothetical protein [Armatimonadota bacterium]
MVWRGWLGLLGLWLTVGYTQPAGLPEYARAPELVVLISAQPNGVHQISWTFNRRILHATVRQRLEQLQRWSQHAVTHIEILDDSLKRNPKPNELFTVASFLSSGLVNLQEGTVNLTPIVRACADLRVIHVYVLLPQQVEYAGYWHYASPHLQMWTEAQPRLWRSVVHIYTPEPTLLEVPLKRPLAKPQASEAPTQPRPFGWLVALIIFAAAVAGVGLYWGTAKLLKRDSQPSIVQPEPKTDEEAAAC